MSAVARRIVFSLVAFALLILCARPVHADSVSVTGNGYLGGDSAGLSFSAGIFSASSAWPFGPGFVGSGNVGVQQTMTWGVPALSGAGFAVVNFGNQFTDILSGGLDFTSTFSIPASALLTGTFMAPVTVSGFFEAFKDLSLGHGDFTQGPLIGTLDFTGTGTATFRLDDHGGGFYIIDYASSDFTGNGTVVAATPEPTSLVLMGTGLAALALLVRQRRSHSHLRS